MNTKGGEEILYGVYRDKQTMFFDVIAHPS